MPATRMLRLALMAIGLLASGSYAAAQEALQFPFAPSSERGSPDAPQQTESEAPETENEPREEEARSPFEEPVETDRDAFTPSTKITPINRWILESSYSFIDNHGAPDTNSFPEMLLRYGVNKYLELH